MTIDAARLPRGPWAAAVVDGTGVEVRSVGLPEVARLEIGSITKGLTGMLYVDAIDRGEVRGDDVLGQYLDLGDTDVAKISLASLAVHRSGLPTLPAGLAVRRTAKWLVTRSNPYGDTLEELLRQAAATPLKSTRSRYSNLGFQLLGHAVAAAAGTTYRDLLHQRVAEPLGLSSLVTPSDAGELGPHDVTGRSRLGRHADAWTGEAIGPAGSVRMTIADLGTLAARLADGTAPGIRALDPVADFMGPRVRVGAAWLTTPTPHGAVTWHNGGTGGFRSWIGIDREAGCAAVLVRARAVSADRSGLRLLAAARSAVSH